MPAAYIRWCGGRKGASSVTNFEAHNRTAISSSCGVLSPSVPPAAAGAVPCPCLLLLLERAYITGLWTKNIFALSFLLQEEQILGSDPSGWWSKLLAKPTGDILIKGGITVCSHWESRKKKENGKTGPVNGKKGAHPCLRARCIIRNYTDLNCHLPGNLSLFYLFH